MKKRGFTVVELIASFTLIMAVVVFLIQIIVSLTRTYNDNDKKTKLINSQAIISKNINISFNEKELVGIERCNIENCYKFSYLNGEEDVLKIENNVLSFNQLAIDLENGTYGDINLDVVYVPTVKSSSDNAIFILNIPINSDIDYNFDVKIVYQFNLNNSNIDEYFSS